MAKPEAGCKTPAGLKAEWPGKGLAQSLQEKISKQGGRQVGAYARFGFRSAMAGSVQFTIWHWKMRDSVNASKRSCPVVIPVQHTQTKCAADPLRQGPGSPKKRAAMDERAKRAGYRLKVHHAACISICVGDDRGTIVRAAAGDGYAPGRLNMTPMVATAQGICRTALHRHKPGGIRLHSLQPSSKGATLLACACASVPTVQPTSLAAHLGAPAYC